MSGPQFSIDIDEAVLARIEKGLDKGAAEKALDDAATDLTYIALDATMAATPVVTGTARRQTVAEVAKARHAVVGSYPYARWLDSGTDSRGRAMKTKPGGYQLKAAAMKAAVDAAPAVLDKAGREILARAAG